MEQIEATSLTGQGAPAFLLGRFDHALDPKKRLTIPAGWRDLMGNPKYLFVLPDPSEPCLTIMPFDEMQMLLGSLRKKSYFDRKLIAALRTIGANSEQLSFDVQGRIRISDRLLKYANLQKAVTLVGAVNRIQLWDPAQVPVSEEIDVDGLNDAFAALM